MTVYIELGRSCADHREAVVSCALLASLGELAHHRRSVPAIEDQEAAGSDVPPEALERALEVAVLRDVAERRKHAEHGVEAGTQARVTHVSVYEADALLAGALGVGSRQHGPRRIEADDVVAATRQLERVRAGAAADLGEA